MATSEDGAGGPAVGPPAAGQGAGLDRADVLAWFYVAVMVLVGSTTAVAARYIVRELPVAWVPILRFGTAGACLLAMTRRPKDVLRIARADGLLLVAAAALAVPVNQSFFLNAARLGPTSHVGLFYAAAPLVVLVLAWALRYEPPDVGRLWGVLANVLGVVIIGVGNAWAGGAGAGGDWSRDPRAVVTADFLLVGAVLSWGGYLTFSKPLVMRHGAVPSLTATFLVGALLDLPIALWASPAVPPLARLTWVAWTALALLALVVTPLNLACQNLALRRMDASQVANFSNIAPVLTVVWGILLFHERMIASLVLGGALTIAGALWTGLRRAPEARPDTLEGPSTAPGGPTIALENSAPAPAAEGPSLAAPRLQTAAVLVSNHRQSA